MSKLDYRELDVGSPNYRVSENKMNEKLEIKRRR